MHKRAARYIQFFGWAFIASIIVGLVIGELAWTLVVFLIACVLWSTRQSVRLHQWLYDKSADKSVPESYGLWGDLFEGLYHIQQQNQVTRNRLTGMIERVRTSTNALKDAVIMTNGAGQMDWWNDAAGQLFGFRDETDVAQLITNLVRDPDFKRYFNEKRYDDYLELNSSVDPNIVLRVHITLFGAEDRLIVAQDVTRIHHLEQMRKDFVSNVSHEMRTPLTVIHGYLETMSDAENIDEQWQRPIRTMSGQTQRLEVLVSDLLLLERYETEDRYKMENLVDVQALLASVCKDAELFSADSQHTVTLVCESQANILGEENQLRSAFSNLVFNAVKYTPDEGQILVRWDQDRSGGHLTVKDNGCGIAPEHIPRLTERFYRADPSRHAKTGGSGLGLAIVKHVLINHSATLEVNSVPGQGSEFSCHFPTHKLSFPAEKSQVSAQI